MSEKDVWVVGAGAIGSVFAAGVRSTWKLRLFDSWAAHVAAVRESGLVVDYPEKSDRFHPEISHFDDLPKFEQGPAVIALAVKSNATAAVIQRLLPNIADDSVVVSLQNGVNEEMIADLIGADRTIGAVVDYGGALIGPGRVQAYSLESGVVVGELDGAITPRVEAIAGMVDGIPVEPSSDIWGALWSKLIVNVQVNALCALTGLPTDALAADRECRGVALALAREAVAVASRISLTLDPAFLDGSPQSYLESFESRDDMRRLEAGFKARWTGDSFRPSMLQDVERGRATEIDALNGYVVAKGLSEKVATPVNSAIVALLKRCESEGSGTAVEEAFRGEVGMLYDAHVGGT